MTQWTKQQSEAIYTKGSDILVAAAAGSGKTAVLVERIIKKVTDTTNPINIDALMVATFTNAAAQEMRTRVQLALESALEKDPTSDHLKKQATLIGQASISTLHSFCLDLVKRYSYKLDLDPGFRIASDIEADLLRQTVLEELFEHWYSPAYQYQADFFEVVDCFSSDRHDRGVERLIFKINDFAMKNPFPKTWMDQTIANYDLSDGLLHAPWFGVVKKQIAEILQQVESEIKSCDALTKMPDGPFHYSDTVEADLQMIHTLQEKYNEGIESLQSAMQDVVFKALSRKRAECDPELKERFTEHRKRIKHLIAKLDEEIFSRTLEDASHDLLAMKKHVTTLMRLVDAFQNAYQLKKKENGLVDFNDLEHFALAILIKKTDDGFEKTEIGRQLSNKFEEVLIDEYQDTNMVQETILKAITKEKPGNLFMVGDVKQSIVRP